MRQAAFANTLARVPRGPMVAPFARALSLLAAFTPQERWLGNRQLSERAHLPPSTTARIAHCLVDLGYLHYDVRDRKYRLAAYVLALGYGALAEVGVQGAARAPMQEFADSKQIQVSLSSRERLDMVVVERCGTTGVTQYAGPQVGSRLDMASSTLGCAYLAALPEAERYYLMEQVERSTKGDWARMRRRIGEAIAQVKDLGYCASMGESRDDFTVVATPVLMDGRAPFVLAASGPAWQVTRARFQQDLGPRLRATAETIAQRGAVA